MRAARGTHMRHAQRSVTLLALALIAGCANPDRSRALGDPTISAKTIAQQVCVNCHGVTGASVSPNFPNLAGQTEAYIVAQLNGFKSQNRQDPAGYEYMWGLSHNLTEEQITGLASYYARQTLAPQPVEGDASRLPEGKALFETGHPEKGVPACIACHGNEGQGNGVIPRLAGQHADYIVKQLIVFQRTEQRPEGSVMKVVAHGLTGAEIEDLAAYVQTLPGH